MTTRLNIRTVSADDLGQFFVDHGEKPFRAKQVMDWLWKKSARSFDEMSSLSLETRKLLKEHFEIPAAKIHSQQRSSDGTIKVSFRLFDGNIIEGVLIPTKRRMTACISSQVGCNLACKFCATGMIRYIRNLHFDEIYDQVAIIDEMAREEYGIPLSNVVYMGMGEPLLNYQNVLESVEKLTSPGGLGMSPQRITISSVGIAPMIKQLGTDKVKFNFALSLHVANDAKRDKIIPYNKRSTIKDLIEAMRHFHRETGSRPTIEYLMLRGFNDTSRDARELADFCKNFPVKVNLIQYNPVESSPFLDSGEERITAFKEYLERLNIIVNVRRSRGKDIDAACGQLANKIIESSFQLSGNIVDVVNKEIFQGTVHISAGKIVSIKREAVDTDRYILPGLIDAHIHIESSMLIPSEFARLAVVHGTVATVSDPHEIANVLGVEGVRFMISNGKKTPFKFYFGAPSCVPATTFETSGATIGVPELEELMAMDEIRYMSEMMNFPGVLSGDKEVMAKLDIARRHGKPVDGHAPGLIGEEARRYIEAGISTDHECFTIDEALEKIRYGMKILIREGSAAKNFDALADLLQDHADDVMFCSDDRHPNDLVREHVNSLIVRAINKGHDPLKVLRSCIYNPVRHYNLDVGMLQEGDDADMIVVDNLHDFNVLQTYIRGQKVAEQGQTLIKSVKEQAVNKFNAEKLIKEDLQLIPQESHIKVIQAMNGQLITKQITGLIQSGAKNVESDTENDILKLVVYNRYQKAKPAIAFINGFGLKEGAIASSVAHDSHNIIAVGVADKDITTAINMLVEGQGGVSLVGSEGNKIVPLPVAGLMSAADGYEVATSYESLDEKAKSMGSPLNAPYMTLSFMALLVIPELKLSDQGLFDGKTFGFTSLFTGPA